MRHWTFAAKRHHNSYRRWGDEVVADFLPEYHPHYLWLKEDHLKRRKRYVRERRPCLVCQECRGAGSYVEDVIDYWEIRYPCGWCEGTGLVTPHERGLWLRCKKEWITERMIETI